MSFFSRKRQTSQATNNAPPQQQQQQQQQQSAPQQQVAQPPSNVTVAQPPSQALAQTQAGRVSPSRERENSNQDRPSTAPSGNQPNSQQPSRPIYPWSARRIALPPPLYLPRPGAPPPTGPSPSPFPRYGHSLPLTASQTGELFLFGGLVRDSVRNDLYTFNTRDLSTTLVQTTGEIPPPRVGHASALVSSVLIVWGGDTKTSDADKQDEGLYLLNLGTREWTRVATRGAAPAGRYGHSVAMCGSRFYVFGGQVDGEFLNDLWCFDLNTLKSAPLWELITPGNDPPPRRTGHVMVAHNDTIYIFGGTDGSYHYNDTWAFDVNSRTWSELTCIGYIPVPREGHAAALVDDVIYVFGGRGVDGKDLGDLAAFKISNQRWFMFQNMGPAPSGRSGHAMATAGPRIFVLGGESFSAPKSDDPMLVHVLDTKHIRYPDSNRPSTAPRQTPRTGNGPERAMSPNAIGSDTEDIRRKAASPTGGSKLRNGTSMPMQSLIAPGTKTGPGGIPIRPKRDEVAADNLAQVRNGTVSEHEGYSSAEGPSRDRDRDRERVASPEPAPALAPTTSAIRSKSPTQQMRTMSPIPNGINGPAQSAAARSTSPSPPSDAFRPTPNGVKHTHSHHLNGRMSPSLNRGSTGNVAADLVQSIRAKDIELDTLKRREVWMKAALSKAAKAGFVWPDHELEDVDEGLANLSASSSSSTEFGEDVKKLADLAMRLKQDRATLQTTLVDQAKAASERFAEAERGKQSALQEAAFCRAKLQAYESGKINEATRMETDRAADLERQLSKSANDRDALERKVAELTTSLSSQSRMREQAEEQISDALKRATQAEESFDRVNRQHTETLDKLDEVTNQYRRTAEQLYAATSAQELRDVGDRSTSAQVDELKVSRDQHLRALEQAQAALKASSARAEELQEQWRRANDEIQRMQTDITDLNRELEVRTAEADSANARLRDVENAWAKSREEADTLRALTTGSLGELLDFHRDLQADEDRVGRAHAEKARVMEHETTSLRNMVREANQRVEEVQSEFSAQRKQLQTMTSEQVSLRAQISGLRAQLANAVSDTAKARQEVADRESQLRELNKTLTETELKLKTFRNYLADNGLVVDEEEIASNVNGAPARMYEIEAKLAERTREQESLSRQLQTTQGHLKSAEDKIKMLNEDLAHARDQLEGSDAGGGERVAELEQQLAAAEASHKERLQAMEQDYRTAVMCVKGTEKMLRRMKEELTKTKSLNASLQSELDSVRGGSSEGGSRIRGINGRGTPGSDEGNQEGALRSQLGDAQRAAQRLTLDNQDLHRKLELAEMDVETFRKRLEILQQESDDRLMRIDELQEDNEQLQDTLKITRQGRDESLAEQLSRENIALKKENDQLSHKIELLLEVDPQSAYGGDNRRISETESDDLDYSVGDWQRRLASTTAARGS